MKRIFITEWKQRIQQQLRANPLAMVLEVLLVFGSVVLIAQISRQWNSSEPFLSQGLLWGANVLMILLVWTGQILRGERFRDLGFAGRKKGWKNAIVVFLWSVLVFVLALSAFIIAPVLFDVSTGADTEGYAYFKGRPLLFLISLLGVYAVSSFGEEYLYRAFLMDRMLRIFQSFRYRKLTAILISAAVFGLAHYSWGATGVLQTAFMGLVLAGFYLFLEKRLIILVLAHAYMDTLLFFSIYYS